MKKWKCVLTLVVLFHLCHSVTISIALSKELLRGLGTLNNLYRFNKLKFTSSACVGVFVRELKHILDSVMVPENSSYVLYGLMANLEEVGKHKEVRQQKI
ncbi:hypothetical protein GBF38_008405 [Nibea albiflora]|uniref:Uncharacterized protein n=1 Tax=Nibea albiflora TaxID=240163 RepID=A0ACB7EPN8_NIBAL|nr:hypothetical protein GBF38_008405 [Nibea albiflora]